MNASALRLASPGKNRSSMLGKRQKGLWQNTNKHPIELFVSSFMEILSGILIFLQVTKAEYISLKREIYDEIAVKLVPDNVLSRVSVAVVMLSRTTGQIAMTELLPGASESRQLRVESVPKKGCEPGVSNQAPVFATSDVVPFRFTPNMQTFIKPIFTDGVLASGIMAIARSLTEPEVCTVLSCKV